MYIYNAMWHHLDTQGEYHTASLHLTHKQLETRGCVLSAAVTDALVLEHKDISN